MKNKNGKIIFWASVFILAFSLGLPAQAADDHSHFEAEKVKAGVILSAGFRSDAEIGRFTNNSSHVNNYVHYDSYEDAAAALLTGTSLGSQVRPAWSPNALTKDGDELWIQYEVKWDNHWLPDDLGGLDTHKAFQFADGGLGDAGGGYYFGKGALKFEIRSSYSATDSTAVGAPTFRMYQSPVTDGMGGDAIRYCLSSDYCTPNNGDFDFDTQPGGDTWCDTYGEGKLGSAHHLREYPKSYANRTTNINPYLWLADTWNRVTVRWTRVAGVERVTVWAQNETTGPVKIIADPKNSNQGYKVDYPDSEGFNQFWFEFNSSQEVRTPGNWYIYFRNFIASRQPIGLGSAYSTHACSSNAECSDGNLCNGTETCSSGTCLSGTPVKTDDGVACTTDSCNPSTGQVTHSPNNNLCADTSPCTTNERCDATQGCLKTTISQCANSDGCCPSGCTASNDSDCGTTQPSGSLVIDFESTHIFGLANWTTLLKDQYTNYVDLGPGGMTTTSGSNASYNYQGVQGSVSKYFTQDDRIIATWYNAGTSSITFTPYVSFNDPDRRLSDTVGNWYLMSALTLSPGQTGTTQYIFDQATAGSHLLVNINANFSNYRELICDKIEYKSSSSSTPGDLNSDGKVDIFDYSLFISDFGKTGTGLAADLNSDGKVDIFDYSMFISNFGK